MATPARAAGPITAASAAEEIAALRGTRSATLRDLLVHPSFSRLWRAMLVSSLGDWVGFVAVAALVARLGGQRLGGLAVAGVMLARLLPSVLFGPFAGVFADRFNRKRMMVSADIARGLMYASMPFMPGLWAIFGLSFYIECLSLVWTPAKDASVPNLVPRRQLSNANSVGLITTYGTLPLGATVYTALAGAAISLGHHVHYFGSHPEFLALWLDALTFLFSARMIWGLDLRQNAVARARGKAKPKLDAKSALEDVRAGYRFLNEHQLVRAMTIGIVLAFAGAGSVISLGPVFALYSLNAGSTGFGFLITAFGVGMGAGMGLTNFLAKRIEKDRLVYVAMLFSSGCLFLLAAMPTIGLASLFTVPMGMGVGIAWVTGYTLLQENVTDEFRGRTFATLTVSARMTLFVALVAFPAVATAIGTHTVEVRGWVLDLSGPRIAMWGGGLVVVLAAMLSRRGLKRSRLARPRSLALVPRVLKAERAGLFIVFEGVEGAGKGTQIELAGTYLRSTGHDVVVTREPGGTEFGDRLRETILDPATGKVDPRAEALVFAAARAHLVTTLIRPALDEGKLVLCDRFIDSSLAYQGVGRGLGEPDVLALNAWATQGLFPDLVVLLHLEPEEGLARAGDNPDRFESEDIAFHAKVADAYLKIAEEHTERFAVVDASGTSDEVHGRVRIALDSFLAKHGEGTAGPT
jgi:dTMP kinase